MKDLKLKCSCGCPSRISLIDFGYGYVEFNFLEKGKRTTDTGVVLRPKDLMEVINFIEKCQPTITF